MTQEFREKQKFTQWWLWLLLIISTLIPIYGLINHNFFDNDYMHDISDPVLIGVTFVMLGIIFLFLLMNLSTEIDHKGIRMKFYPFISKDLAWKDIKTARVFNYGFVGGWGIRSITKFGTVYNIKGNKGLVIELQNGNRFVIGTQKEQELRRFIEKIRV